MARSKTNAGDSDKPLRDKLGIKPGDRIVVLNPPAHYWQLLGTLPPGIELARQLEAPLDFIHYFVTDRQPLKDNFLQLQNALAQDGMLWISWPKGSSRLKGELNENIVRQIGLEYGMVDVKVVAIDTDWSGLKFVFRREDRQK